MGGITRSDDITVLTPYGVCNSHWKVWRSFPVLLEMPQCTGCSHPEWHYFIINHLFPVLNILVLFIQLLRLDFYVCFLYFLLYEIIYLYPLPNYAFQKSLKKAINPFPNMLHIFPFLSFPVSFVLLDFILQQFEILYSCVCVILNCSVVSVVRKYHVVG